MVPALHWYHWVYISTKKLDSKSSFNKSGYSETLCLSQILFFFLQYFHIISSIPMYTWALLCYLGYKCRTMPIMKESWERVMKAFKYDFKLKIKIRRKKWKHIFKLIQTYRRKRTLIISSVCLFVCLSVVLWHIFVYGCLREL